MDLSVKLVLRARAEGTFAIRAMRQETSELAAAMKEVRAAAASGGRVSPSSIKALGGFDEFNKAFAQAQKELSAPAKGIVPADAEKAFRAQLRMANTQAKVRLEESQRAARGEAADAKSSADALKREAEGVLAFKQRMWSQQARGAEAEASAEARAAEQAAAAERRSAEESLRANLAYWRQRGEAARREEAQEAVAAKRQSQAARQLMWGVPGMGGGGHAHGRRGVLGELGTAAEYTLTYGAINQVLGGLSAIARSPFALGKMTLGVAERAREIKDTAASLGVSARDYQSLRYSFAGKGLGEEHVQPMLQMAERSTVAALRHIKSQSVAFQALHISMGQLKADSRDPMKLLTDISDAIGRIKNPSAKTAIADIIFGRQGSKYLPVLDHGYLKRSAAEAQRSGAVMSGNDLDQGLRAAEQWRSLKLQVEGIKNETAAGLFPILSELLGSANSWIKQHRADISNVIQADIKELKNDLPAIERGISKIAISALEFGRELAPALHAARAFAQSPFYKYMSSGQLVPGGPDLSDPKQAHRAIGLMGAHALDPGGLGHSLYGAMEWAAYKGMGAVGSAGHVEITVKAAPGTSVTGIRSKGNVSTKRGTVQTG